LARATVASSSISLLTLMESERASAFKRSCLWSGSRIVKVDMEDSAGIAQVSMF
jgi:hypothetical protein